jgi:hypothetical protein
MKNFLLFFVVLFICSGTLFCQKVYRASEALSVNRSYIPNALSGGQFKWTHYESRYFNFHYLAEVWPVARLDSVFTAMDKVYLTITKLLQDTAVRNRIDVFLVGSKKDVEIICGRACSAVALLPERRIVFSNHPATTASANLPHEIMHVCSMDKLGLPFDFFLSEGLASYACDKAAFNYDFHSISKYLESEKSLPALTNLLNHFYRYNEITGYYSGASFIKFVLGKYGLSGVKALWTYGVEKGAKKLGTTVNKLEKEWHIVFMKSKSINNYEWEKLKKM